jgi:GWxTD domain-containing protein
MGWKGMREESITGCSKRRRAAWANFGQNILLRMNRWLLCTALSLFCASQAAGIEATMARSVFYRPEAGSAYSPVLELYWQVNPRSLVYRRASDSTVTAHYYTSIRVLADADTVRKESYIIATPARVEAAAAQQSLLDLYRTPLPPGKYRAQVTLTEQGFEESTITLTDTFTIESAGATAFLSDVQFLDTFYSADRPNPFTKDGVRAVPLCADFLDDGRNNLHYYAERYGLERIDASRYPLRQRAFISKRPSDPPIHYLQRTDTVGSAVAAAVPQTLNIAALTSGNWVLSVLLEDKDGKAISLARRRFQRLNTTPAEVPKLEADTTSNSGTYVNLANTFLSKYKAEQIRAMLKMVLPIADLPERAAINLLLEKPDDLYSRYFLYNFYNRRNAFKPEEAWKAYAERVREVNKLFGSGARPGYETDRGSLYLKYGAPAERILVRAEAGALPYEVWVYEVLPKTARTSYFLFYQPAELIGDYRLLHSTVPDEVRNPAWRTLLYPGGRAGGLTGSRAEQYFGNR